jgi:hypothetical protein
LPCIGAFVILLGTNLYAFDKVSISPHGSVFMLARMAGDGNVREVLEKNCIQKKWYLCEWENRLPIDSDDFLWNDKGPVWSHPGGPIGLAPEASEIVSDVFRTRPWAVLLAGLKNMTQQLWLIQLGDTLHPDHLDVTVAKSVRQYFSAAELARLNDSRQMRDTLAADAVWFSRASSFIFCLSVAFGICFLVHAWLRFDRAQAPETVRMHKKIAIRFILIIWVGVLANAFATGALSKPHHRYQARIAWLLVLPPLLLWRYTNICKKQGQSSLNHSR